MVGVGVADELDDRKELESRSDRELGELVTDPDADVAAVVVPEVESDEETLLDEEDVALLVVVTSFGSPRFTTDCSISGSILNNQISLWCYAIWHIFLQITKTNTIY